MRILGFDLGDGESAVALLDGESFVEPRMLPLSGRVSMLSAVGTVDGRVVVGEAASALAGARDVQVRFKSRYLTDPTAALCVRAFAQGVLAELTNVQPGLSAQVTRTVVGCPAGWGEGRRAQYAALIESAGFPNVFVVPEPRAAFLYARHARGLRIDADLMRSSALVVDIGSSTTDFAYIIGGRQQNLSLFGDVSLGGGLLDELILRSAVERSAQREALERVFAESLAWRSYCELQARRLKERYFLDEERWKRQPLHAQTVVCYDETLLLDLSLDEETVSRVIQTPLPELGGRSFVGTLHDALRAAQDASRDCPPQVMILTGGASRMAFFREACREAFPDALAVLCPEPECSVARGLAYAGRVDENLRDFREGVASITRGEKLRLAVEGRVHALYAPLADVLFDVAAGSALHAVSLWKSGGIDTLEALETYAAAQIADALGSEETSARIHPVMEDWTKGLLRELEGELQALCTRCGIAPEKMTLAGAQVDAGLHEVGLSIPKAFGVTFFTSLLGVALTAVLAGVCGGGGFAMISAGPAGLAAGASAGLLLTLLGREGAAKAIARVKLPVPLRKLVADSAVEKGLSRQRERVTGEIIRTLSDPAEGFCARLCSTLGDALSAQLEEMAGKAEMSIEV